MRKRYEEMRLELEESRRNEADLRQFKVGFHGNERHVGVMLITSRDLKRCFLVV